MGAIETMMLDCANSEVGKRLGLPTQGYIALSDAKRLDAQAGLETGMGALLAGLSGINSVSGPGMLAFESCQSLEKLVLDDEICGMVARLRRGIEPREELPAAAALPGAAARGAAADRGSHPPLPRGRDPRALARRSTGRSLARWREEGSETLAGRAAREVERLIARWVPSRLGEDAKRSLRERMGDAAARAGMPALPRVEA